MSNKKILTNSDVLSLCHYLRGTLQALNLLNTMTRCYAIPNGGIPALYALASVFPIRIVDDPELADFFFDDIIDSGATMEKWCGMHPEVPFLSLIDKTDEESEYRNDWVVFPWEGNADTGITDHVIRLIQFAGDDPNREGLQETPARVAKALQHWYSGYSQNPEDVLKVFKDGGETYNQMVVVKDIPIYSKCEHHMADIFGTATIAYIPDGKIVGLSKLSRLADIYARRLQVQERLTQQVAEALFKHLNPKGVGVMIKARHMCMESRGICQQGHHTITTALMGAFLNEPETRAEFMAIARQ